MIPAPGDLLWSTCAADVYGIVVDVGSDGNETPTIDILIQAPNDLIGTDNEGTEWPQPDLAWLDLPAETPVHLRGVQYRTWDADWVCEQEWEGVEYASVSGIFCRTPGQGCYRCISSFMLLRRKG